MARARTFDEEQLLDVVIEQFWTHGYRGSSLTDLSAATGVTNGSLYQAYGSKWALFLRAFRRYCDERLAFVEVAVPASDDVAVIVRTYIDAVLADCLARDDRRGCLMLNSISELGDEREVAAIIASTIDAMEARVAGALSSAVDVDPGDESVAAAAANVVAVSQAIIQMSRLGRDATDLRRMGDQAARATGLLLAA